MKIQQIMEMVTSGQLQPESYISYFYEVAEKALGHYACLESYPTATDALKSYPIEQWLCTDTYVGQYLYVIDGVPAVYMFKPARKHDLRVYFISKEGHAKFKEFLEKFLEEDPVNYWPEDKDFNPTQPWGRTDNRFYTTIFPLGEEV